MHHTSSSARTSRNGSPRLYPWALASGLLVTLAAPPLASAVTFARENILGTSFELTLAGLDRNDARAAESRVLDEIDRLSAVLSTYNAESVIRRHMAGEDASAPELSELLALYDRYRAETRGCIHVNLARVRALWSNAEAAPNWPALEAAFSAPRSYNVDALGKAYIIDRCVDLARTLAPAGLLNVGGDARAWGGVAFPVRLADPFNFSDNGPGITTLHLRESAIAASGSYLRGNHLIDPRTLAPASAGRAATVTAPTAVAANAWATALCIASEELTPTGITNFTLHTRPRGTAAETPAATQPSGAWPAGYQVRIGINLKTPTDDARPKRPYVAVWVEDERGHNVRNVAFWAREERYFSDMTAFWKAINSNYETARALISATRLPGQYSVTWDGKDNAGNPVPQGKYRVRIEVSREHGEHVRPSIGLQCGASPTTLALKATVETEASEITYGPAR